MPSLPLLPLPLTVLSKTLPLPRLTLLPLLPPQLLGAVEQELAVPREDLRPPE